MQECGFFLHLTCVYVNIYTLKIVLFVLADYVFFDGQANILA